MDDLLAGVRQGQRRAIARLITRVENSEAAAEQTIRTLYRETGRAHIVGVTGAPGSGKSTLVNEVAKIVRQSERQVGIVAVDPSSPFTGGALLGDRVPMRDLSGDDGVFIRSLATRGQLGGLARATGVVVKILDAAGFDLILVETVGAGQSEVDIASAAHTTLVIEAPGMGDDIQAGKAGILEIADILVVNKADRPLADRTVRALRLMLHMGVRTRDLSTAPPTSGSDPPAPGIGPDGTEGQVSPWSVPVIKTVATEGTGVAELVEQIDAHNRYLRTSGEWRRREEERSRREVFGLLQARLMARLTYAVPRSEQQALFAAVAARQTDPYSVVARLFAELSAAAKIEDVQV